MKNNKENTKIPDIESLPRISLIIPYDPKMRSPQGLHNLLTTAVDKTEKELKLNYPEESVIPVIKKLRCLIKNKVCSHPEKSIGIFVSPLSEKVCYFTPTNISEDYVPPVLVQRDNEQKRYLKNTFPY